MLVNESFRMTMGDEIEGWHKTMTISDTDRLVTIYKCGSMLAIGFKCTIGPIYGSDWRKNFEANKKSLSVGAKRVKVHAGFVKEYLSVRNDILAEIETHKPSIIVVTGFSQGGAHATLCFRDLLHNTEARIYGYAFGSPRVYGLHGASEFNKAMHMGNGLFRRYTAYCDPVPHLPPWIMNYFHVGKCTTLYGQGFPHSEEMYYQVTRAYDESTDQGL